MLCTNFDEEFSEDWDVCLAEKKQTDFVRDPDQNADPGIFKRIFPSLEMDIAEL